MVPDGWVLCVYAYPHQRQRTGHHVTAVFTMTMTMSILGLRMRAGEKGVVWSSDGQHHSSIDGVQPQCLSITIAITHRHQQELQGIGYHLCVRLVHDHHHVGEWCMS